MVWNQEKNIQKKHMKYLTLNKILSLLLLVVVIHSCKNITNNNKNESSSLKKDTTNILSTKVRSPSFDLKYLQGIWKSYSYYLEHEEEDKDEHLNEYYKIVVNNNCLDVILKDHVVDNVILKTYEIGFTDNKNFSKKKLLNSKGSIFIRLHKKNYFQNRIDDNDVNKFEMSQTYSMDIDMYKTFEDGFKYHFLENDEQETVQFRKINALPQDIFRKLKEISKLSGVNFIKEFNIKEISKQVKVTKAKAYFYNEMNENTCRNAFLIKNDSAYLENIEDGWVKGYYDGKIVTNGYMKISDIKIID